MNYNQNKVKNRAKFRKQFEITVNGSLNPKMGVTPPPNSLKLANVGVCLLRLLPSTERKLVCETRNYAFADKYNPLENPYMQLPPRRFYSRA